MVALVYEIPVPPPPRPREEVHAPAMARGARCDVCPLYGCGEGPVMGEIRPGALMTIVGEAPGPTELETRRPFMGWSGGILNMALNAGGLTRLHTSVTNTILCRPQAEGGNYKAYIDSLMNDWKRRLRRAERRGENPPDPPPLPQACCAPRLQRDIAESGAKVVLAVGKQGLEACARELGLAQGAAHVQPGEPYVAGIAKQHGAPVILSDGRVLMSSYHPAMAAPGRGRSEYLPVIQENLARAAWVAARAGYIPWAEPVFRLNPTAEQAIEFCRRLRRLNAEVTVDIETSSIDTYTTQIRCVGVGTKVPDEEVMVIPFRHMDGSPWWPSNDVTIAVALALREVVDGNPLVFQNGSFDTSVLLTRGLMTDRLKSWTDCYLDSRTEFLTRRGWLKYDDVRPTDELATLSRAGHLEWQHYFHRVKKAYTGEVYDFETERTRCIVTGNHRMYSRPVWRNGGRRGSWRFQPAEQLVAGSPDLCEVHRAFSSTPGTSRKMTVEDARLLGLFVSEGSFRFYASGAPRGIRISQKRGGRAARLADALPGFKKMSTTHREAWRKKPCVEDSWFRDRPTEAHRLLREVGRYSAERRLPPYVFDQSVSVRRALLDALMTGDGTFRGPTWLYSTLSKRLADDVQLLALTLGSPATIHRSGAQYVVDIRPDLDEFERLGPRLHERGRRAYAHVERRRVVEDKIVCFSVPNETLVTRVGGKVAFQGNTMLLHHDTPDNDLPHDLGFIARRYFCAPMWKSDIDHKSVDNVNDANLHLYNARDVLITQRLVEPLRQQVEQWQTGPQYQTDYQLAPVLREMGHIGLVVDEERRGEFSEQLNWQAQRELYQFREIVGKPKFNPRSVPQLQDLIFREWGYLPVLGLDGYEIKRDGTETWQQEMLAEEDAELAEEEVGSTSSGALIELMKKREMKPEHIRAVKTLLEYRAYDKLRGTYVDTLRVRPVDWAALGQKVDNVEAVSALVWDGKLEDYVLRELLPERSALSLLNTVYKAHVVPTGRLATQPAVQNWPALGKANMREMVVAPPGHVMIMGDYAQLEARLYAVAARDALLLQAIRDKKDIHSMNAAALLAKNAGELEYWYRRVELGEGLQPSERKTYRKYWRTVAKRFAFLEIYGGEEDKLFSVMAQQRNKEDGELSFPDLKRSDVDLWHENWHRLHPETKGWHAACHAFYEQNGYAQVPAIDFRKRYFLGGLSKKNAVPNMTIQGFASSIANQALLRIVARIPFRSWSHWTGVVLQVHDALALYAPREKEKEARGVMEECMYHEKDGVPFPAELGCATRWSKTE